MKFLEMRHHFDHPQNITKNVGLLKTLTRIPSCCLPSIETPGLGLLQQGCVDFFGMVFQEIATYAFFKPPEGPDNADGCGNLIGAYAKMQESTAKVFLGGCFRPMDFAG